MFVRFFLREQNIQKQLDFALAVGYTYASSVPPTRVRMNEVRKGVKYPSRKSVIVTSTFDRITRHGGRANDKKPLIYRRRDGSAVFEETPLPFMIGKESSLFRMKI